MISLANEIWKDIPGYEGRYRISDQGRVYSTLRGTLKPYKTRDGYLIATLTRGGHRFRIGVHRLVASAFIPNPEGKPQINHIDGNKENNSPGNLEWVTCSENNLHRRRVLNGGGGRAPKAVMCLNTGKTYRSLTEAAKAKCVPVEKIIDCCKGRRNHTYGTRWAYAEEVGG